MRLEKQAKDIFKFTLVFTMSNSEYYSNIRSIHPGIKLFKFAVLEISGTLIYFICTLYYMYNSDSHAKCQVSAQNFI